MNPTDQERLREVVIDVALKSVLNSLSKSFQREMEKEFGQWGQRVGVSLESKKGLGNVNAQVARGAQSAILTRYDRSSIKSKTYRNADPDNWKRFSGGLLKEALSDPKLIVGSKDGIKFVNKSILDTKARQWYRLNFGTKPAGSRRPRNKPMSFFGRATSAMVSLKSFEPSAAFSIPRGWWATTHSDKTAGATLRGGQGRRAFYPTSDRHKPKSVSRSLRQSHRKMTKGIRGRRFLDAGTWYINRYYPPKFESLAKGWLKGR